MSEAFLKVVNMSISAGWLVLAVLALRLILKKAPRWVNVLLWGIVAIRLICPFSIESALSLIPSRETISPDIMMDWTPEISTGIVPLDQAVNPVISTSFAPSPGASANPLQILIPVAANLWLLGVIIMLAYTAISYLTLRRKLRTAVILRGNIFQCETVSSPFVLGILKPHIYLPYAMDGQNLHHVVAHEQAHIQRKDHWWKPLGFLLLTVYWFNPLMWVAYILLCRDIELACDEKVIAELGSEQRADYTQALVACAVNHRMIAACPLAFGEVGVKERVKSVMNYKKTSFWMILISVLIFCVMAVCFLTDPQGYTVGEAEIINESVTQDGYTMTVLEAIHCENMISVVADIVFPIDNERTVTHPAGVILRSGNEIIKCNSFSSTDHLTSDESGYIIRYDFRFKLDKNEFISKQFTLSIDGFSDSTNMNVNRLDTPLEISWKAQKFGESRRFTYETETCSVTVDISSIAVNVEVFQTEKIYENIDHILSVLEVYDKDGRIISIKGSNGGGYSGSHIEFTVILSDTLDINSIEKVQLGNIILE